MLKLPKIVCIFLGIYLFTYLYVNGLNAASQQDILYRYGFIPLIFNENFDFLHTLLTYHVLHSGFTHLMLNGLWFLVFGTAVAREVRAGAFVVMVCAFSVIAALAYFLFNQGSDIPMIGASGVVCGLMGASLYILPQKYWHMPAGRDVGPGYQMALRDVLSRGQVQQFIVIFHLINVVMAFQPALFGAQGGIAWEAHIAGFWAGILAMPLARRVTR